MSSLRVMLLGTGTSHGVPMIGCDCSVCTSSDPRDHRSRPSILMQYDGRAVLVDTTPELRLQCIAGDVREVGAILFTHHHADHVVGLDDVRRFNAIQHRAIPIYGMSETLEAIATMFPYAFDDDPSYPSSRPLLDRVAVDGPFELFGRTITPIRLFHGEMPVLGFRVGGFAYCTDCSRIPDESLALLTDLDVLVLDALRRRPHPTHFNLAQAIEMAERIEARQTYFTHIAHELPHADTNAELPPRMALAYDGQVINVQPSE